MQAPLFTRTERYQLFVLLIAKAVLLSLLLLPSAPARQPGELVVVAPASERMAHKLTPFGPGYEHELVTAFARQWGYTPRWTTAQNREEAQRMLQDGLADLAVGFDGPPPATGSRLGGGPAYGYQAPAFRMDDEPEVRMAANPGNVFAARSTPSPHAGPLAASRTPWASLPATQHDAAPQAPAQTAATAQAAGKAAGADGTASVASHFSAAQVMARIGSILRTLACAPSEMPTAQVPPVSLRSLRLPDFISTAFAQPAPVTVPTALAVGLAANAAASSDMPGTAPANANTPASPPAPTHADTPASALQEQASAPATRTPDETAADTTAAMGTDAAITHSTRLALFSTQGEGLPLRETTTRRWFWRGDSNELSSRLHSFWEARYTDGDTMLAALEDRYFGFIPDTSDPYDLMELTDVVARKVPAHARTILRAAASVDMDPLLLTAVIFQESRFDNNCRSFTGVRGIMQLTQETALFLKVNRMEPTQSIRGGARYLRMIWDGLEELELDPWDRWCFTLAAFNQGPGNLKAAMRLSKELGGTGRTWRELKEVFPLLSRPKFAQKVKASTCRGYEAVDFVEKVRWYYYVLGLVAFTRPEAEHLGPLLGALHSRPSV